MSEAGSVSSAFSSMQVKYVAFPHLPPKAGMACWNPSQAPLREQNPACVLCSALPALAPAYPGVWWMWNGVEMGEHQRGLDPTGALGMPGTQAPPQGVLWSWEGGRGAGTTGRRVWLRLALMQAGPCAF